MPRAPLELSACSARRSCVEPLLLDAQSAQLDLVELDRRQFEYAGGAVLARGKDRAAPEACTIQSSLTQMNSAWRCARTTW